MAAEVPGPAVAPPVLRVTRDDASWTFDRPFTVGRDASCDVVVDSARASRHHLDIGWADGTWWLTDPGSANGTLVNGVRIERHRISGDTTVQIGEGGPLLRLAPARTAETSASGSPSKHPPEVHEPPSPAAASRGVDQDPDADAPTDPFRPKPDAGAGDTDARVPFSPPDPSAADPRLSYDAVVERYFGDGGDEEEMGERTRFIRQAYSDIQKAQQETTRRERSTYRWLVGGALLVAVVAIAYAGYREWTVRQLRADAAELFLQMKEFDVAVAQQVAAVQRQIEANPGQADSLNVNLEQALERRRQVAARYDRFVRGLGVYDGLSSEEELIYQTARNFGESELTIPPEFVDEVKVQIRYWQRGARWREGVRRAQEAGYDVITVNALRRHGMPTEFFYLALQESDYKTRAVGPWTRYGHAKGAWQFIPETGRRYGLEPGPLVDTDQYDPLDERHDFRLAAPAAARYLNDIYTHLAQASGLLVCASYNWGEGRVKRNMRDLRRELSDIENDPAHRTYWKFLTTYRHRMPTETKDYVMKIFAAAVIGQNPRQFGIDMDPPVQVALRGGRGGIQTDGPAPGSQTIRLGGSALERRRASADSL